MAGAVSYGAGAVTVEGLGELQAALRELDVTLNAQLREGLVHAAEPVRDTAESMAIDGITRMKFGRGPSWSEMRVGITSGIVYVAPKRHGARGRGNAAKRPNLATLLVVKAMEPAAEQEHARVEADVERTLELTFRKAGL